MYGNTRHWGTCSIGATSGSDTWYLSEGCTLPGFETWLIIYNPGPNVAQARCHGSIDKTMSIPAGSRLTFNAADLNPGSAQVYIGISSNHPVVVERAMYGDPNVH